MNAQLFWFTGNEPLLPYGERPVIVIPARKIMLDRSRCGLQVIDAVRPPDQNFRFICDIEIPDDFVEDALVIGRLVRRLEVRGLRIFKSFRKKVESVPVP